MKTILIVDDEPLIRILLRQTLEELEGEGVQLLQAADGAEAIQAIEQEHPDLVFLDVMMPVCDGYEVCRRAKQLDQRIYVVFLTAKGQSLGYNQGGAAGADEYITKPFDPDAIVDRARAILGLG